MRRILFLGRKTVEVSTYGVPEGKVEIIERDLGVQRRRQNSRGEFVVASISSYSVRGRICIPVSEIGTGWKDLASVLTGFVQGEGVKDRRKDGGRPKYASQSLDNIKNKEKATYTQVASSGRWPKMSCEILPSVDRVQDVVEVIPSSCSLIPFLRDRSLVGTLVDWKGTVPRANELERWCNTKWGIGVPVEVKDMNGSQYMFILPTKAKAHRISSKRWNFEQTRLDLKFWEDWCGCFEDETKPETLWIRVLGLPVFLWSEELFRAIGDRCGGYITTAVETQGTCQVGKGFTFRVLGLFVGVSRPGIATGLARGRRWGRSDPELTPAVIVVRKDQTKDHLRTKIGAELAKKRKVVRAVRE
ncbi:hypothetical protein Acr_16g0000190 [Actinidia rufa]|uniref:DUF4283 domain-containing protein n=1 Tax=Actinidia rufa TaxID=165716 RepID=A0A7J0FXH8_9ERIC|nr:hypothetical protein Acr_16g0000190 [Actinidia rufa]